MNHNFNSYQAPVLRANFDGSPPKKIPQARNSYDTTLWKLLTQSRVKVRIKISKLFWEEYRHLPIRSNNSPPTYILKQLPTYLYAQTTPQLLSTYMIKQLPTYLYPQTTVKPTEAMMSLLCHHWRNSIIYIIKTPPPPDTGNRTCVQYSWSLSNLQLYTIQLYTHSSISH